MLSTSTPSPHSSIRHRIQARDTYRYADAQGLQCGDTATRGMRHGICTLQLRCPLICPVQHYLYQPSICIHIFGAELQYLRQVSNLTPDTTSHCYSCEMRTVIGLTRLTLRSDQSLRRNCKGQTLGCAGTGLEINRVSRFIVAYARWCYTRGFGSGSYIRPPLVCFSAT